VPSGSTVRLRPDVLFLAVMLIVFVPGAAPPTAPTPRGYVCVRARTPVLVDGKLDDPAWADAPWSEEFVDIEGIAKPRPRFRTRVKMLWDDQYFYVAAQLEEPHVWANLTQHDSVIFHDNDFEVFIDPDGDNHEYYEFEINARNTSWDLFLPRPYRDGGKAQDDWEIPGLKTATYVDGTLNNPADTDRSWSVEIAFPWKVLGEHAHRTAPPGDGDQWRVDFSRVEWRHTVEGGAYKVVPGTREDNWVWSPPGVVDMHQPERWGYVQFSTAGPGQAAFRPDPAAPVRDRLIRIYHAQQSYRKQLGTWAPNLDALQLGLETTPGASEVVLRRVGDDGYEAAIVLDPPDGGPRETWTVQADSRLRRRLDRR
jgi:hypothetical protein